MTQTVDEKVDVVLASQIPKSVIWRARTYKIDKIGLHHTYREGRTLYHVFSAVAGTLFLRLRLDTDSLSWKLEEVSDEF